MFWLENHSFICWFSKCICKFSRRAFTSWNGGFVRVYFWSSFISFQLDLINLRSWYRLSFFDLRNTSNSWLWVWSMPLIIKYDFSWNSDVSWWVKVLLSVKSHCGWMNFNFLMWVWGKLRRVFEKNLRSFSSKIFKDNRVLLNLLIKFHFSHRFSSGCLLKGKGNRYFAWRFYGNLFWRRWIHASCLLFSLLMLQK